MKLSHALIAGMTFITVCAGSAFASTDIMKQMVSARDHINGLEQTLTQVNKDSNVTVVFPAFIPKVAKNKKYYASSDATSKQGGFTYMINVDSTPQCNGVKYCNVGRVTAHPNAKVDMMTTRHNKSITVPVDLADGTKAYFTPGHAMGDYFPASIQWVDNNVLYMISWNMSSKSGKVIKESLITMANSAKNPGSG